MSQEKLQEVVKGFNVNTFHFGTGEPETQVQYEFHYSGPLSIQSVAGSCSCVGMKVLDNEDGTQSIVGELKLGKADTYKRKPAQYILDGNNVLWLIQGKAAVSTDPRFGRKLVKDVEGQPIYVAEQTITVMFDDGQAKETIDENKVVRANEKKLQTQLKITGFVDFG